MLNKEITVIIGMYKRPVSYLETQLKALREQTIPPKEIWIWYNKPEDQIRHQDVTSYVDKVVYSTANFKFLGRFSAALLARTPYVAIFDDDTVPGKKWFENCFNTIETGYDGILGVSGVVLAGDYYEGNVKVGWNGVIPDKVTEVDLVGHGWFMKKDHLRYLWYEEPITYETGEDMQLSYLAQKYGNVKTYVPAHDISDIETFGCIPSIGKTYAVDRYAESVIKGGQAIRMRSELVRECIKGGWQILKNR